MAEYWSDVNMWRCTDYKTGCTVLDSEVFRPRTEGDQPKERVAIVTGINVCMKILQTQLISSINCRLTRCARKRN